MPSSEALGHSDAFVLLPEHSASSDSDLVPVWIHRAGESEPVGANELVAAELGLPARIVKTTRGYLLTLPESLYPGDTVESLAARVLAVEHKLLPAAVQAFAEDRVREERGRVWVEPVERVPPGE